MKSTKRLLEQNVAASTQSAKASTATAMSPKVMPKKYKKILNNDAGMQTKMSMVEQCVKEIRGASKPQARTVTGNRPMSPHEKKKPMWKLSLHCSNTKVFAPTRNVIDSKRCNIGGDAKTQEAKKPTQLAHGSSTKSVASHTQPNNLLKRLQRPDKPIKDKPFKKIAIDTKSKSLSENIASVGIKHDTGVKAAFRCKSGANTAQKETTKIPVILDKDPKLIRSVKKTQQPQTVAGEADQKKCVKATGSKKLTEKASTKSIKEHKIRKFQPSNIPRIQLTKRVKDLSGRGKPASVFLKEAKQTAIIKSSVVGNLPKTAKNINLTTNSKIDIKTKTPTLPKTATATATAAKPAEKLPATAATTEISANNECAEPAALATKVQKILAEKLQLKNEPVSAKDIQTHASAPNIAYTLPTIMVTHEPSDKIAKPIEVQEAIEFLNKKSEIIEVVKQQESLTETTAEPTAAEAAAASVPAPAAVAAPVPTATVAAYVLPAEASTMLPETVGAAAVAEAEISMDCVEIGGDGCGDGGDGAVGGIGGDGGDGDGGGVGGDDNDFDILYQNPRMSTGRIVCENPIRLDSHNYGTLDEYEEPEANVNNNSGDVRHDNEANALDNYIEPGSQFIAPVRIDSSFQERFEYNTNDVFVPAQNANTYDYPYEYMNNATALNAYHGYDVRLQQEPYYDMEPVNYPYAMAPTASLLLPVTNKPNQPIINASYTINGCTYYHEYVVPTPTPMPPLMPPAPPTSAPPYETAMSVDNPSSYLSVPNRPQPSYMTHTHLHLPEIIKPKNRNKNLSSIRVRQSASTFNFDTSQLRLQSEASTQVPTPRICPANEQEQTPTPAFSCHHSVKHSSKNLTKCQHMRDAMQLQLQLQTNDAEPRQQTRLDCELQPIAATKRQHGQMTARMPATVTTLSSIWTIWYLEKDTNKTWAELQNEVGSVSTMEDFWRLYDHLKPPSELKVGTDYSFFRQGITPMWEDPANNGGGRWVVTVHKNYKCELDTIWLNTLMFIISDHSDMGFSKKICGAVVNVRSKNKISIWLMKTSQEDILELGKRLKEELRLTRFTLKYREHKPLTTNASRSIHVL